MRVWVMAMGLDSWVGMWAGKELLWEEQGRVGWMVVVGKQER